MSNSLTYTRYHDEYHDTGDIGGDVQRAMDAVSDTLDECGLKINKENGKVWAEEDPLPMPRDPVKTFWAEREVTVYPEGACGKDHPAPIGTKMRLVPVKRIPLLVLLPGEEPKSDSAFDRAISQAKQIISRPFIKNRSVCPFAGTLSMLWHGIQAESRRRKVDIDMNVLDDTLRMIKKAVPETSQANYSQYQYFVKRIIDAKDIVEALSCLQRDYTVAATEMHKLRDFKNDREVQLESVAYAMGTTPDQLISCDLFGNVIGGRGAYLTNQGRWTEDVEETESGELYADYHNPRQMEQALDDKVSRDAFYRINTGAGKPDHKLIFDPKNLIKKPLGREFWVNVSTYTLYLWPRDQKPTQQNIVQVEAAGFWSDIKRKIAVKYPKDLWQMDVECHKEKVSISTQEPVYKRPSWHLGCSNPKCDGVKYYFNGVAGNDMTELARQTATPDEWMGPDEKHWGEIKRETEELLGMPLIEFMHFNASRESCSKCGAHYMFVNPQRTLKIDGKNIRVPVMIICRNHGWWTKPVVMDDWDTLLRMYGGDKIKAAERMGTIGTPSGLKYAEQVGNTTYTWPLDWLQQEDQIGVRKLKGLIANTDLMNVSLFNEVRDRIYTNFSKKQRRFLTSWLYTKRSEQQWVVIEHSQFVSDLRRQLATVTIDTFHKNYGMVAKILFENQKLSWIEKHYGWALINALKSEFILDAEKALVAGIGCNMYQAWIEGLKLVSFRHLKSVSERAQHINANPESVFLIKEEVKLARRRLTALARTTSWIEAQENYLYSVEAGDTPALKDRLDDINAASFLTQSAAHLRDRIKEVSNC